MHLKYEVKTLARAVLLPTTLLIWAIIAFLQEGNAWKNFREKVEFLFETVVIELDSRQP